MIVAVLVVVVAHGGCGRRPKQECIGSKIYSKEIMDTNATNRFKVVQTMWQAQRGSDVSFN